MGMEITNHIEHLSVTFDRLIVLLGLDKIVDMRPGAELLIEATNDRVAWIRTADLAVPGVTTDVMALHHLLWFQHIGRVVVEDVDPLCGAVKIRIHLPPKKETGTTRTS
jgi:uncharacterized membrane protein YkgB